MKGKSNRLWQMSCTHLFHEACDFTGQHRAQMTIFLQPSLESGEASRKRKSENSSPHLVNCICHHKRKSKTIICFKYTTNHPRTWKQRRRWRLRAPARNFETEGQESPALQTRDCIISKHGVPQVFGAAWCYGLCGLPFFPWCKGWWSNMSALFAHDVYIWWLVDLTTQKKQQHLELGAFLHGHFVGFPSKTCVVCCLLWLIFFASLFLKHPPAQRKKNKLYQTSNNFNSKEFQLHAGHLDSFGPPTTARLTGARRFGRILTWRF